MKNSCCARRATALVLGCLGLVALPAQAQFRSDGSGDENAAVMSAFIADVDVSPGLPLNQVNIQAGATCEVAILASPAGPWRPQVTATNLNDESITFGPKKAKVRGFRLADVNGDFLVDRIYRFNSIETGLKSSNAQTTVSGRLKTGEQFQTYVDVLPVLADPYAVPQFMLLGDNATDSLLLQAYDLGAPRVAYLLGTRDIIGGPDKVRGAWILEGETSQDLYELRFLGGRIASIAALDGEFAFTFDWDGPNRAFVEFVADGSPNTAYALVDFMNPYYPVEEPGPDFGTGEEIDVQTTMHPVNRFSLLTWPKQSVIRFRSVRCFYAPVNSYLGLVTAINSSALMLRPATPRGEGRFEAMLPTPGMKMGPTLHLALENIADDLDMICPRAETLAANFDMICDALDANAALMGAAGDPIQMALPDACDHAKDLVDFFCETFGMPPTTLSPRTDFLAAQLVGTFDPSGDDPDEPTLVIGTLLTEPNPTTGDFESFDSSGTIGPAKGPFPPFEINTGISPFITDIRVSPLVPGEDDSPYRITWRGRCAPLVAFMEIRVQRSPAGSFSKTMAFIVDANFEADIPFGMAAEHDVIRLRIKDIFNNVLAERVLAVDLPQEP